LTVTVSDRHRHSAILQTSVIQAGTQKEKSVKKQTEKHKINFMARHKTLSLMFMACLLIIISTAGWRIDFFSIHDRTDTLFASPVPHGCSFITEYIHSVEKTAVTDEYILSGGKIWSWEERVSSSNAGMPSVLPNYMHFLNDGKKLIFRGGRISEDEINLRVGNEKFGRNCALLASYPKICLYRTLPDKRLTFAVSKKNLLFCRKLGTTPFTAWLHR